MLAYVALGGNLGDVLGTFRRALLALAAAGVRITNVSPAYRTLAWSPEPSTDAQPDYWNAAIAAQTTLDPQALLSALHEIEHATGRRRLRRWENRVLDLDLLLYGDMVLQGAELTLPHPGMRQRIFVLRPLCDIAPRARIPPGNETVTRLLHALPDANAGILGMNIDWHLGAWREVRRDGGAAVPQ